MRLCLRDGVQGRQTTFFVLCLHKNWVSKQRKCKEVGFGFKGSILSGLSGSGVMRIAHPNDLCHLSKFQISLPKEVTLDMRLSPSESVC